MTSYRCILFDLDHTLWDYDTNSAETLHELYHQFELRNKGVASFDELLNAFREINTWLWDQYDQNLIHRDVIRFERFHKILLHVGVDDYKMSLDFSGQYLEKAPRKGALVPHAIEILDYLHQKYPLLIITNGFEEIQSTKVASAGITPYFKNTITSARAGHKKPAKEIFEFALNENGFKPHEAIMIGDNLLTDIAGAKNASVDTVFFNPAKIIHQEKVNYEIHDLLELKNII